MKRKKILPAWTKFQPAYYPAEHNELLTKLGMNKDRESWRNSRYQVDLEFMEHPEIGRYVMIGIKDHERTARHDWRDFQRIKNELVGEQYDAVEVYPAEDKLVDTANQYYMFAFLDLRLPFGFQGRLVAEGNVHKAKQRPFEVRPPDCLTVAQWQALAQTRIDKVAAQSAQENTNDESSGPKAVGGSGSADPAA